MKARPIIYVNRITNLSDARYCAGMGANLLGFNGDPGHTDYISGTQFKEIMGWVSGPSKVVELENHSLLNLQETVTSYSPDFLQIQLRASEKIEIPVTSIPLILTVNKGILNQLKEITQNDKHRVAYIIISQNEDHTLIDDLTDFNIPVLMSLGLETGSMTDLLAISGIDGFVLQGSSEVKPGLKDYDHLSAILEALDY